MLTTISGLPVEKKPPVALASGQGRSGLEYLVFRNGGNRNNVRKRGCCKIIDSFRILSTFRNLARYWAKPYYRIIEIADNDFIGNAPFLSDRPLFP